ncbi:hypothetical protein [Acinetobacter sp. MD2]|uniref:hypothetical protein n=1 Tax=Acinetobacter sp. MD2 TaxID=2600066 RepID=UPI002D1EEA5C|nr:hypothetical protein [Acinetobacter sp. MD2]MEB3767119.1 hypothetical protein [Acinetobacter sp. MD2]
MSINRHIFKLKPSKIAWFFQMGIGLILIYAAVQLMPWWQIVILTMLFVLTLYGFIRTFPKLDECAYLDGTDWTLKFIGQAQTTTGQLKQVIDHRLYVVLYWTDARQKPSVIWQDQLDLAQWKILKTLAQLHTQNLKLN